MVHHAIYYKQNYSYLGIIEALSGVPFDVSFISFDDIPYITVEVLSELASLLPTNGREEAELLPFLLEKKCLSIINY